MFALNRSYARPYGRIPRLARLLAAIGAVFCLIACTSASAGVVYVNKNAAGATHNGLSWATAFLTVQGALDAAYGGDEVWVAKSAPATAAYVENITLPTEVGLYGGFAGTETDRGQRDWKANIIIPDGNKSTTANVVTSFVKGAVVDGFTVRNGGYDIYISGGTVNVANCTISGDNQNGIVVEGGTANVSNCAISGNSGGITVSYYGSATISHCAITENGYGIRVQGGTATINNCTISGNFYGVTGGKATIAHCIVAFNGTGVYVYGGTVTLSHTDVYGSSPDNFRNIPDPTGTNGNISQDPRFVSRTGGDYHLTSSSPCIDAGDDAVVAAGEKDAEGRLRIIGKHTDIGAFEYGVVGNYTLIDAASCLRARGGQAAPVAGDFDHLNVDKGGTSAGSVDWYDVL